MEDKIIAIIPARKNSKRISRKNTRLLKGKPLICYTLEETFKSKYIDQIVISTDDEKIIDISLKYKKEKKLIRIIKRPSKLSTDTSKLIDVVLHTINIIKQDTKIKLVVILQPTSPLRLAKDIDNAIEIFLKNDCESVISVTKIGGLPYWSFKIKNNILIPIFNKTYLEIRSQDLPKTYIPNGAIFISTPRILNKYKTFYCNKIIPYIMPPERSIDIDEEIDLKLAEFLLNYKSQ